MWLSNDPKTTNTWVWLKQTETKEGYVLEVKVEYPLELHKNHNELSVLAERMKFVSNLDQKKKYVRRSKNLENNIKEWFKILKKYIKLLDEALYNEKYQAKTEFEKDFFKFMNNSVCGKTLENIKNHKASFQPRETT